MIFSEFLRVGIETFGVGGTDPRMDPITRLFENSPSTIPSTEFGQRLCVEDLPNPSRVQLRPVFLHFLLFVYTNDY